MVSPISYDLHTGIISFFIIFLKIESNSILGWIENCFKRLKGKLLQRRRKVTLIAMIGSEIRIIEN